MLTVITVIVISALLFRYIHSLTEVQGSLKRLESLMSSMSENIAAIRRQGEGEPVPVEKERGSVIEEAPVPQPQPQPEANIQMVEPKPKAKTPPPPVTFTPMQHFDLPVAEPAEVTPPSPSEPTKMEQWANAAWNWLCVGEEWRPGWIPGEYAVAAVQLLRAAALLLLFGAAWFVRYIHEQGFFSPMGRVVAGFVLAAALVVAGSCLLRNQWRPLGLVLAGLGFALGEFFDWAGANLYGVIPASGAFAIAAVLALGAGAMAWRHASLLMGLVALFAGYSAPLFFPEAVRVGDVVLLAWLLLLAAEGAALAMTRGWRCLTWITLVATIALAAPVFEPNRLAALGRGWALGIIALFAIFTWTESLGHALLHRHAPLKFDLVSWVAVTAVSAMAGIVTTYVHVFSYGFYHWPLFTHGLPALVLAVGGLALALAFHLRGIGDRATFEWLIDGVSALVLAFACHSFEGTPRCVALCVAAVCFVLIAARQGNAIQAICALLAWVLWLVYVGTPASAAERIGRIGPMVASLCTEHGFQTAFVEGLVVGHEGETFNHRLNLCPHFWEHWGILSILTAEAMYLAAPVVVIVRLWLDERIERFYYLAIANNHYANRANGTALVVSRLKIYCCKISHGLFLLIFIPHSHNHTSHLLAKPCRFEHFHVFSIPHKFQQNSCLLHQN